MAEELALLGKVIVASLLGGLVGLEREFADKPAGLRTHMLVGATSAFLVILAYQAVNVLSAEEYLRTDPIRMIEAIVVGISFLGAGTILKNTGQKDADVEGLTTSASILSVAAVGIAVGLNNYILAVGVTVWNLFINWGLKYVISLKQRGRK
jgi:putative Mg2+ transporter-C (MgtC) family protein